MKIDTEELIIKYKDDLFRIAFHVCQNKEDSDDAVQETFIQYHISVVEFQDEMHIKAWLIRVVINKAKDLKRSVLRRFYIPLEEYMETLEFETSETKMTEQELYKKAFLPLHAAKEISLKRENTILYTKRTGRKIKTACACVLGMLLLCNTTCYAAYQIYQTKHLTVFFKEGITQSEIDEIGKELNLLSDCAEVELQMEYVNADQAWETFCNEYLDDDLKEGFDDNPLEDSANYQITIKFFSDTNNVRKQIENIPGVRMVVDQSENYK